ncbi:RDD family protein [Pseudomonas gingeri]|uniref:RDD family protein n=1 Tax=Pseudomonas gingeri TaxID=117681 RepID=A0A7Y7YB95_9PSED|nr:RDD family protein [Pseudomonas gingeri]NWA05079.1 RDD family protein [Pseudomonas gingeri]NWA16362.1 RDD family protein [Pseudomonas gingeri]NWA54754.1 RDD family protein [Pseudomonas gingeri]NWA99143.1 RDD family protein [Pseudomonas gingeri]NWB05589.1 RDD family protein [Pseudomonas gingeri]
MPKHVLSPQGEFPAAGLGRRLAAMFYDFLLCTALLIVTGFIYKGVQMVFISEPRLKVLSDAGALDGDPLFSTVVFCVLFAFFAKFWTYKGQTLGMQVWGIRVQNADGTAISLLQALLRFMVSIASWLFAGLGFIWVLFDKRKRSWHDIYSNSQLVRIPKQPR